MPEQQHIAYYEVAAAVFVVTLSTVLVLRRKKAAPVPPAFERFQRTYLAGYLLATSADWLQGPYMYALYNEYGLDKSAISLLFVMGYLSSAVFGTLAGSLGDRFGRKVCCLAYCVLYGFSVATKHFKSYHWLLAGRAVGGISTSLLHSCFEAWAITEHRRQGFDSQLLSVLFANQVFGNSCVAILCGLVGQFVSGGANMQPLFQAGGDQSWANLLHFGGVLWAFDIALVCLISCAVLITFMWRDSNFLAGSGKSSGAAGKKQQSEQQEIGSGGGGVQEQSKQKPKQKQKPSTRGRSRSRSRSSRSPRANSSKSAAAGSPRQNSKAASTGRSAIGLLEAMRTIGNQPRLLLVGFTQTAFEGSMHIFIFMWTPLLTQYSAKPPHGLIFAVFMMCCMVGSALYKANPLELPPPRYLVATFGASVCCFLVPVLSSDARLIFGSFLLFEASVGGYFPAFSTIKGDLVPEHVRTTMYTIFRIPLNAFVVAVVTGYSAKQISEVMAYQCCALLMATAALLQAAYL